MQQLGTKWENIYARTVDSRSNGSAYNKNFTLATFLYIPLGCFSLFLYNGNDNISLQWQVWAGPLKNIRAGVSSTSMRADRLLSVSVLPSSRFEWGPRESGENARGYLPGIRGTLALASAPALGFTKYWSLTRWWDTGERTEEDGEAGDGGG